MYSKKKYEEMEQIYSSILRAMPDNPKGNKDFNYLTGLVITYYYNALMYQGKTGHSEKLTDSLLNSSNPYYTHIMRPDLLAASSLFYLAQNRIGKVDSLGQIFLATPPTGDPRRDARNRYNMAWAMEFCDIDSDVPLHMMEQAMEYCRNAAGKVPDQGDIYSYTGYLYWRNGELEKATSLIQEAIDWYIANHGTQQNGLIETYSNLSRIYVSLQLFDKAIEANSRAVEVSKALDNWTLEEVYRMRAVCFEKAGITDSALFYVQKAIEATPQSAEDYFIPNLLINRLGYYFSAHPDSIPFRLEECRRLLADTATVDQEPKNNLFAYYGMALLRTPGHELEGIKYLEQSFSNFCSGDYPEGILFAGDELIRAYIHTGMTDRIAKIYTIYTETSDSLQHEDNANAAIGANIRYETGRKEQENIALAAEIALKQRTLIFTWLLTGLLAALLVTGAIYLRQRQRYLRRISDARLSRISGLLHAQQELRENNNSLLRIQEELRQSNNALSHAQKELSSHNATLAEELHTTSDELQKTSSELGELSSKLDNISKEKSISEIRVKISTELFNSDKEAEFRRNFTAAYPGYIASLHKLSPNMTRTDELIAMLLLLDLSNHEIALTLGISKNGVNKARSRMRQRLGLSSETVLEEFLKNLQNNQSNV